MGKTILHHTGSMFGIGCLVSDEATIQRICRLKQRDDSKGFIVLVPDVKWFEDMEIQIPERIIPLTKQYWPGNLTLVLSVIIPSSLILRWMARWLSGCQTISF